jgi:uncharacterized radical SAM superfamily Fe-S cluster-containing enzyme
MMTIDADAIGAVEAVGARGAEVDPIVGALEALEALPTGGPALTEVVLGETESVCPECLARIRAVRVARGEDVYLRKACPAHGTVETVVWRGQPAFRSWQRPRAAVSPERPFTLRERGCPFDCGLCADHRQQSCCVLLEVTLRCDLRCAFCFASAGHASSDPSPERLAARMRRLYEAAGPVNLQLSGGEPCVRDDLPAIAAVARQIGFPFIQVNTNGLRLARDPAFGQRLRDAGVATVFLQFDGTRDEIHRRMRGRPLLQQKIAAIENCGAVGLGVVLVPVVVPEINADNLGDILRFAVAHQPIVRGIHFQPVSYFGRYPTAPTDADRITLPEIMAGLQAQTDGLVRIENFRPAGAENALCSFSGSFVTMPDGRLHALTRAPVATSCCAAAEPESPAAASSCCAAAEPPQLVPIELMTIRRPNPTQRDDAGVGRARDFVARSWAAPRTVDPERQATPAERFSELDVFLARAKTHTLVISGMAFQDAWTLDLDRLRDCHIHIAEQDGRDVPFCAYNLTGTDGRGPYRPTHAAEA